MFEPKTIKEKFIFLLFERIRMIESQPLQSLEDYLKRYEEWRGLLHMLLSYLNVPWPDELNKNLEEIEKKYKEYTLESYFNLLSEYDIDAAQTIKIKLIEKLIAMTAVIKEYFYKILSLLSTPKPKIFLEIEENEIDELKKKLIKLISQNFVVVVTFERDYELEYILKEKFAKSIHVIESLQTMKFTIQKNRFTALVLKRRRFLKSKKVIAVLPETFVLFLKTKTNYYNVYEVSFSQYRDKFVLIPIQIKLNNVLYNLSLRFVPNPKDQNHILF